MLIFLNAKKYYSSYIGLMSSVYPPKYLTAPNPVQKTDQQAIFNCKNTCFSDF